MSDHLNTFNTTIGVLALLLTMYLAWRANKVPSLSFGVPRYDPDKSRPIKWWYVPISAKKTHFWQLNIIEGCTVKIVIYSRDNKSSIEKAMLWRTSQGPKQKIDVSIKDPDAIVPLAVRHTLGEDFGIDADPIRLSSMILKTNTAIFTDEDAINERKLNPLREETIHGFELSVHSQGKEIARSHIYMLYVPAISQDNDTFKFV